MLIVDITARSVRKETIHINWGAYPHYKAPELFAPFILDGRHLYYVNAFENAASTMETSAVAAENIARLILSRHFGHAPLKLSGSESSTVDTGLHSELWRGITYTLMIWVNFVGCNLHLKYHDARSAGMWCRAWKYGFRFMRHLKNCLIENVIS